MLKSPCLPIQARMKLYNTRTRKKEEFTPANPAEVKLYTCGPTVYNFAHIGNLRTYIFEDLLRRALEWNGYQVKHVMNITDVGHLTSDADTGEDKMKKGAEREKKTVWQIAEAYTKAFFEDFTRLNCLHPTVICKATDHIKEMIALIQKLEKNGFTYAGKNGNVYFDTSKFPHYGALAQLEKQELKAGARIEVDENKKNPHDFVLWFVQSKHGDQDMQWDSPWGKGFPGWHMECSAMALKYLGDQIDIHCGGIDHIPVHHTNEIAQSEAATGKSPWVNVWMHGNFLLIGKSDKMAKSGENFLTLKTLAEKNISPLAYRYFTLQSHYRKELNFTWESVEAAQSAWRRLRARTLSLPEGGAPNLEALDTFTATLIDDLNAPEALALCWKILDNASLSDANKKATLLKFDEFLGLKLNEPETVEIPAKVAALIVERDQARAQKDWAKSDELRKKIESAGYDVKDSANGTQLTPR